MKITCNLLHCLLQNEPNCVLTVMLKFNAFLTMFISCRTSCFQFFFLFHFILICLIKGTCRWNLQYAGQSVLYNLLILYKRISMQFVFYFNLLNQKNVSRKFAAMQVNQCCIIYRFYLNVFSYRFQLCIHELAEKCWGKYVRGTMTGRSKYPNINRRANR